MKYYEPNSLVSESIHRRAASERRFYGNMNLLHSLQESRLQQDVGSQNDANILWRFNHTVYDRKVKLNLITNHSSEKVTQLCTCKNTGAVNQCQGAVIWTKTRMFWAGRLHIGLKLSAGLCEGSRRVQFIFCVQFLRWWLSHSPIHLSCLPSLCHVCIEQDKAIDNSHAGFPSVFKYLSIPNSTACHWILFESTIFIYSTCVGCFSSAVTWVDKEGEQTAGC